MKMGLSIATVGLLLSQFVVSSAIALTCPYPKRDIERFFSSHHERPETYFLAHGVLRPSESVPSFDEATQARASFRARFEGYVARPDGFDRPAGFELTITSSCLDDNCGAIPMGPAPALMFIRDDGGTYTFAANPCNDSVLPDPIETELVHMLTCLNGNCAEQP